METKSVSPGTPVQKRLVRVLDRIERVTGCMERDKGNEPKINELNEEMEALQAEAKFLGFKVKKGG